MKDETKDEIKILLLFIAVLIFGSAGLWASFERVSKWGG